MHNLKADFLLDPSITFLNHGSFGACPRPVFREYQEWQQKLESQPVEFLGRFYDEYLSFARTELAKFIKANPDDLAFIPNATFGVNMIARSIELKPGDEILSTDHEYGACDLLWEFICKKTGAIYKKQHLPIPLSSPEETLNEFWHGVTDNTRLIFISHITSPTAACFPVDLICQKARNTGILTIIDGAHAPGQIELDVSKTKADFYIGNCHKWMLSPKGAGFLHARKEVQDLVEPLIVSWGYNSEAISDTMFLGNTRWNGTHDPAAYLAVPGAIKYMEMNNWGGIQKTCHELLQNVLKEINLIGGYPSMYKEESQYYQMGLAQIPQTVNLTLLKEKMYEEFRIEVPFTTWCSLKFIRVSIQAYNDQNDLECLVHALRKLLNQKDIIYEF
jgi:isopenicillin-N epimerase